MACLWATWGQEGPAGPGGAAPRWGAAVQSASPGAETGSPPHALGKTGRWDVRARTRLCARVRPCAPVCVCVCAHVCVHTASGPLAGKGTAHSGHSRSPDPESPPPRCLEGSEALSLLPTPPPEPALPSKAPPATGCPEPCLEITLFLTCAEDHVPALLQNAVSLLNSAFPAPVPCPPFQRT